MSDGSDADDGGGGGGRRLRLRRARRALRLRGLWGAEGRDGRRDPHVEDMTEPKGGRAAAGLANGEMAEPKGEGAAAGLAKGGRANAPATGAVSEDDEPVAAAGDEALAALPKGQAMANRDGRTAEGERAWRLTCAVASQ